jgi:hypothetical protein
MDEARPSGSAARSWMRVHSAVGCSVTSRWRMRRRPWPRTTKP